RHANRSGINGVRLATQASPPLSTSAPAPTEFACLLLCPCLVPRTTDDGHRTHKGHVIEYVG
ncbi:MAG TPA: hypothetical protein VJO32_08555, partial [Ktedonobacteraceae bacterium]|nr:hypothetical protein [Ktedonobacteraceae bacterium]